MHQLEKCLINKGDKVVIVDDLLATGGTTNAIAKISADLSNTRIKDLSIRLDKFLVKDCNFWEVITSGKHDGTIKLDYTTRNFRKRKQKDIKLRADVIFTGRKNNLYKIEVEIYVSAFCVNNTYDDLMKDYAYSYMRDLLGSSEELTKLGFNENFLVDINKDEFQKDRFDGFVTKPIEMEKMRGLLLQLLPKDKIIEV